MKKANNSFEKKEEHTDEQMNMDRQKEIEQNIVDILLLSDFGDELLDLIGKGNDTGAE